MGATIPDPRYVTLDASGNGSVAFRGRRPNMRLLIHKITVDTALTGSGTVAIYFRGQLVSSKPIALMMSAEGEMALHAGEEVLVVFTNGRANATMHVVAHGEEVPL